MFNTTQVAGFPDAKRSSAHNRMASTGANWGAIQNFKRIDGVNDEVKAGFRKWTGMPQLERPKPVKADRLPNANDHQQYIKSHRRPQVDSELAVSEYRINSAGYVESQMQKQRARQIPESAWNKVRLAELKAVERLKYPN